MFLCSQPIFWFFCIALLQFSKGVLDSTEQQILVNWYNSLSSKGSLSWITGNNLCGQDGVFCDGSNPQRTLKIDIHSKQLSGTIPTQFGNIQNLQELSLYTNQLSGTIPTELEKLTKLEQLHLHENQFSGTIPTQLGSLSNLQYLHLYQNSLSGTIPTQLGLLSNLLRLYLNENQLLGTIPTQFESFTNLTQLDLQSNQLSGSIPTFILTLPSEALIIASNYWDCPIPDYSSITTNDYSTAKGDCDLSCDPNPCSPYHICSTRLNGDHSCNCPPGYDGTNCEIAINCEYISNEGNANWGQTLANGQTVNGNCNDGYSGSISRTCTQSGSNSFWGPISGSCNDIDECLTNNGGCSVNAICSNTIGSYICACKAGYSGGGKICNDINECLINNGGCHDQAICANTIGSFICSCKPGYLGDGFNCTAIKCLPISIGNANYSTTLAGNIALGKCDDLYYGSPTLYCDLTGYWNQTITGNLCSERLGTAECRCELECGNLSIDKCKLCYLMGGMVLGSYSGGCYCPFDNSFLSLTSSNQNQNLSSICQNPLPKCSTCFSCDSSCLNCFGPNQNQCTSCPPNFDLVTSTNSDGSLKTGECKSECDEGKARNSNGDCEAPNCSTLNDCSNHGNCLFTTSSLISFPTSYCDCNQGYEGNDCSKLSNCGCMNGYCLNFFFYYRCVCNSGWNGVLCDNPIFDFSPKTDSILGGSPIEIIIPSGFTIPQQNLTCLFGEIEVLSIFNSNNGKYYCKTSPYHTSDIYIDLKISIIGHENGEYFKIGSFYYSKSNQLIPNSIETLNEYIFTIGKSKPISWDSTQFGSGDTITIKLYKWNWNYLNQNSNIQPELIIVNENVTCGSNNGKMNITLDVDNFIWSSSLHILSIDSTYKSINRFILPIQNGFNYDSICKNFVQTNSILVNPVTLCPSKPPTINPGFIQDSNCNGNIQSSCFLYPNFDECSIYNYPLQSSISMKCCYLLTGRGKYEISKIIDNYGIQNDRSFPSIKNFIGDILPRIFCCAKSNNNRANCDLFEKKRKVENDKKKRRSTFPSSSILTSKVGICYGDPHFMTFDEQVWRFNGKGEFILLEQINNLDQNILEPNGLTIQGRFEQLSTKLVTILSAISIKDGNSRISIYLNQFGNVNIFLKDSQNPQIILIGNSFISQDGILISRIDDSKYQILLPTSSVSLIIISRFSMLNLIVILPNSLKSKTRGLLGNWNGNKDDDFILRNGDTIPITSNFETLHSTFGLKYMINENESLFIYPNGTNFNSFNDNLFIPNFEISFSSIEFENQARSGCIGSNIDLDACLFDVSQTQNILASQLSLEIGNIYDNLKSELNSPPQFMNLLDNYIVKLSEEVNIQFSIIDEDGDNVIVNSNTSLLGILNLEQPIMSFDFSISEQMYLSNSIPDLELIATDSNGLSSSTLISFTLGHFGCESIEGLKNEVILELKSYCASECNDQCKKVIEKYQEMECFEDLKDSVGELLINSQKSCCESNQINCKSSNLSGGAIAGIVIGSVVGALLVLGFVIFFVMKSKSKKSQHKILDSDSQVQME